MTLQDTRWDPNIYWSHWELPQYKLLLLLYISNSERSLFLEYIWSKHLRVFYKCLVSCAKIKKARMKKLRHRAFKWPGQGHTWSPQRVREQVTFQRRRIWNNLERVGLTLYECLINALWVINNQDVALPFCLCSLFSLFFPLVPVSVFLLLCLFSIFYSPLIWIFFPIKYK